MIAIVILTLVVLFIPFVFFFKNKTHVGFIVLGYLICAAPMLYVVFDDMINNYEDANIGLGLGIFLTWALTASVYVAWLISFIRSKRKIN